MPVNMNSLPSDLEILFRSFAGTCPDFAEELRSSGSNRTYYRLGTSSFRCIGVSGTSAIENEAFCTLARHFASKGIAVPEIYAVNRDGMCYLQEDLGTETLFDRLAPGRLSGIYSEEEILLAEKAVSELPRIQMTGAEGLDMAGCRHAGPFGRRSVMFDLNYFKYCFLKTSGIEFDEELLEDDFVRLSDRLLEDKDDAFMYRDFQSRNVMIRDGKPYFIDFQGGRKGPVYYDVASFVWQARSNFPVEVKERLVNAYIASLREYRTVDEARFRSRLRIFVLFRTLQVLGAYGFRGRFEGKRHFLESIPYALSNLREFSAEAAGICPYIAGLAGELWRQSGCDKGENLRDLPDNSLKVRIFSFSYKKGLPEDSSGNGGGYVFDCRAIHNPGKYERFKSRTGMDEDVKEFLEKRGEVRPFLASVYSLADAHVEKYIRRGFTDLMFSFGCTGGQHRSVYCAEALAAHLKSRYDISVTLIHREQDVKKEL